MTHAYLNLEQAAARLGCSRPTLRRRLKRFGIKTYPGLLDWRDKLVRVDDLERLEAALKTKTAKEEGLILASN